jgi:rhodanese-related sulfurtransferase
MLRLLIVEDDLVREQTFRRWLPADVRPVFAHSAGRALGILRLDSGRVYAGIVLDHDLQSQVASEADRYLTGQDVCHAIIRYVSPDVPILVHSMNTRGSVRMANALAEAGFEVTKIPMEALTQAAFLAWLEEVRDWWEEA